MLADFFKINSPFTPLDQQRFLSQLQVSKHIHSVLYESPVLEGKRIRDIKFENVSFSKTLLTKVTFSNCVFHGCLFIGTEFKEVEIHDCSFEECNFFKCRFEGLYAKPEQFRKAIKEDQYANIAVHLYQQLRENYYQESQREFKNEAEYYFHRWNRKNGVLQAKRRKKNWMSYGPRAFGSWLYDVLLGYGFRLKNLLASTSAVLIFMILLNHGFARVLFCLPTKPSLLKSTYFTITTMATLGASGYNPDTEVGYLFVIINVLIGITIVTTTINSIFKKLLR